MSSPNLSGGNLLDKSGNLVEKGFAFSLKRTYNPDAIVHHKIRRREWDAYYICNAEYAAVIEIITNYRATVASLLFFDVVRCRCYMVTELKRGRNALPLDLDNGTIAFNGKKLSVVINAKNGVRDISVKSPNLIGAPFSLELGLQKSTNCLASAVDMGKRYFCYSACAPSLNGVGVINIGKDRSEQNFLGTLDWGRGVIPRNDVRYHIMINCEIQGKPFGLNLFSGVGEPQDAGNAAFYGEGNKIGNAVFDVPFTNGKIDYLKPWRVTTDDKRVELVFYPTIDGNVTIDGEFVMKRHRMVGRAFGTVTTDNGEKLEILDVQAFGEYSKSLT